MRKPVVACLMLQRAIACASVLACLLAVPSGAAAADVVRPSSVTAGTTVPAGGARTLTVRCPSRAVALGAAVTQQGAGLTLSRSGPGRAAGDWRFRFADRAGAGRRGARVVLRCVRLELASGMSGARLEVSTRRRSRIAIPPGESSSVAVRCRRGWTATGYGISGGGSGDVTVAAAVPRARGWEFELENTGSGTARAAVAGRCLKRDVPARSGGRSLRLRFQVDRREFSDRVGPGAAGAVSHRCGANAFSTATGSAVDPLTAIELARSHPVGERGGSWRFRRATSGDEVTTHIVCLARRTQFR
jgi:hypothetical protein